MSSQRILQVVTLVSPDGAYGGPVRVAANQCRALLDRGHDVTLAAGTRGYETPPSDIDGVPLQAFPVRSSIPGTGFAGLRAPGMPGWIRANSDRFDVVHVHLARDLVTLPAARAALSSRLPLAVQTHGMIDPSSHPLATPLDAWWTKSVLRAAGAVYFLTPREREDLITVGGPTLAVEPLANGVPELPARGPISGPPEILYLARLHPRKRPEFFVQMAKNLLGEGYQAKFALAGPDEGEGSKIDEAISCGDFGDSIAREPAVAPEAVAARMAQAAVYVLPSVDEPYPMSALEAMSMAIPVVITDTCGLAPMVRRAQCGIVVDERLESLTDAVRDLLDDPAAAAEMGCRAQQLVRGDLSMSAIGEQLERSYRTLGPAQTQPGRPSMGQEMGIQ